MLALLLALLALSLVPGPSVQAQEDAERPEPSSVVGRAYLGAPEADPPYLLTMLVDHDQPDGLPRDDARSFEFILRHRQNSTPVQDGPGLQAFLFRCERVEDLCDPDVREATELGATLSPEGTPPGTYRWDLPPEAVFDQAGPWHVFVRLAGEDPTADAATARFELRVAMLPAFDGLGRELLAAFFGLSDNVLFRILAFVSWLLIFYAVAKGATGLLLRTVMSPRRVDPTVGRLTARMMFVLIAIVGLGASLYFVWRIDFWAGLTALGLLTVALGFGMQNSVANVMGGINLALDKPFTLGDRVRVGDTWGDVQEIGLRSTKIETVRHEVVIIPNKLLDEQEIWNFTRGEDEYRLDIDVGISYDSDRRLAEAIMLRSAADHPELLDYPRPRVLLQEFAESGLALQLRVWLRDAKKARPVASELRKRIKDAFDAEGVEIPFPYRTLVYKKDLPRHKRADPETMGRYEVPSGNLPKMLYSSAGAPVDKALANFVTRLAKRLEMALVVVHHEEGPPGTKTPRWREAGFEQLWDRAATGHNVPLEAVHRRGPIDEAVRSVAKAQGVDLVVLGTGRSAIMSQAHNLADLVRDVREKEGLPVLVTPKERRLGDRTVNHYEKLVSEREARRRARDALSADEDAYQETEAEGHEGAQPGANDPNARKR